MNLADSWYHFIGIGGIGMSGLAELLHLLGAKVTGSDPSRNQQVQRLKEMGVEVFAEHAAENLGEADVVVYSSAIKSDHIELEEARKRRTPIIARAEALAELMRLKRGIAVAGTHGKTTTTSLLSSAFIAAQQDPSIVVGGRLQIIGSNAGWGKGPWMIAEADESDGSFKKLSPEIIVLTNIDNDHLDHYETMDRLQQAFHDFAAQVPFYGKVIACGDDPRIRKTFQNFSKPIRYYGFDEGNDYRIQEEKGTVSMSCSEGKLLTLKMQLPGDHNLLNAAAVVAVGFEVGLPMDLVKVGLETFSGVDRRAQWKGERDGVDVFDDYGHHPTEVRATIHGFKKKFPERRLVTCFQPHRYSRTQICWKEFLSAFDQADEVWITDIYPAGEAPIEGVTAERLVQEVVHPKCQFFSREKLQPRFIQSQLKSGDLFLTLGAGDSWKIGSEYLDDAN